MAYLGELISIAVAFSWTATALLSEFGSKRLGNLTLNVLRMALTLLFSMLLFAVVMGSPVPAGGPWEAHGWMLLSGLVGYVIGDYCLFQSYIIIGSRYGQLFMTLAPLAAALAAWVMMGQEMNAMSVLAMLITLAGISISVLGRGEHHKVSLKLPTNGVLFAIGAAVCQGVGLVLSKIGMDYYDDTQMPGWLIPFSANFFRCIAGIIGLAIFQGRLCTLKGSIARQQRHERCYGNNHLWTFCRCGLFADGGAIYECRYCFDAHGTDTYHHYITFALVVPPAHHLALYFRSGHLLRGRQPFLSGIGSSYCSTSPPRLR